MARQPYQVMAPEKMKPTARIAWDDSHKDVETQGSLGKVKIGDELYIVMRGKVRECSHSDYGCSMTVDLVGLEVDPARGHPTVGQETPAEEKAEGEAKGHKDMFTLIKERQPKASRGGR